MRACVCVQACVRPCVCVSVGASEDKQGDGAGPRKGGTFWKSKFDIKSNQLLQPIPSLTAGAAPSTTENAKHKTHIMPFHSLWQMAQTSPNCFPAMRSLETPKKIYTITSVNTHPQTH